LGQQGLQKLNKGMTRIESGNQYNNLPRINLAQVSLYGVGVCLQSGSPLNADNQYFASTDRLI
jgi:hypothetical protein